jgi:hypothetical protein
MVFVLRVDKLQVSSYTRARAKLDYGRRVGPNVQFTYLPIQPVGNKSLNALTDATTEQEVLHP